MLIASLLVGLCSATAPLWVVGPGSGTVHKRATILISKYVRGCCCGSLKKKRKNLLELRRRSILILQIPNLIWTQRPAIQGLKAARDGLVSLVVQHTIQDVFDLLIGVSSGADHLESRKRSKNRSKQIHEQKSKVDGEQKVLFVLSNGRKMGYQSWIGWLVL